MVKKYTEDADSMDFMMQDSRFYRGRRPIPCQLADSCSQSNSLLDGDVQDNSGLPVPKARRQHTARDTLDSFIRKSIIAEAKERLTEPVKLILTQISQFYNQSSFCRLYLVAEKLGITQALKNKFVSKKGPKISKQGWRVSRNKEAKRWYELYVKAFEAKSIKKQMEVVWEVTMPVKKPKKSVQKLFKKSKKSVYEFRKRIQQMPEEDWN